MPILEVTRYTDDEGGLHPTRELAAHANGLSAVRDMLRSTPGLNLTREQEVLVLRNLADWYLAYLGAKS